MSKAEERGGTYAIHKASEKLHDYYGNAMLGVVQFDGYDIKNAYIDGYHQAKKNNELTWEDIKELHIIFTEVDVEIELGKIDIKAETLGYYQEVLKRFNKERKDE